MDRGFVSVENSVSVVCRCPRLLYACPLSRSQHSSCSSRPIRHVAKNSLLSRSTYARELGAAVTALGDSAALLDVKQAEVTTGGLDDPGSVGGGVVAVGEAQVSHGGRKQWLEYSFRDHLDRNSPVAAAVSDSLGNHFGGWWSSGVAMRISPRTRMNFEAFGNFVWVGSWIVPAKPTNQSGAVGCPNASRDNILSSPEFFHSGSG